jgi:outer membrane biogenesis lipoprotein LolB
MLRMILIVLFSVISGCSLKGPGLKTYDLNEVTPEIINKGLHANYGGIRSLSGRFDFSYSTGAERNQSSAYIYITPGDTLYIEIKGLVGETEAVVFIDRDSLRAVNYFEKISVKEKSSDNSIRRMTGMDIGVNDLRNAILSYSDSEDSLKVVRNQEEKLMIRSDRDEKKYAFITLDDQLLVRQRDEYEERDQKYRIEYDYFSKEKGRTLPRLIKIRTFNPPSKLTLFFTSLKLNKFEKITAPEGL